MLFEGGRGYLFCPLPKGLSSFRVCEPVGKTIVGKTGMVGHKSDLWKFFKQIELEILLLKKLDQNTVSHPY
jgi:hypothetical protein